MSLKLLALSATAVALLGVGAEVHTHLVKAEPAVNGSVGEAPKQVRLWFNERPEVALSGATLMKEDHAPVAVIKMAATDDSLSVAGPVPVTLAPGRYMVMWKTGSRDGHPVRGTYYFTYDPSAKTPP
jgi:methionine-rich copper-binding protein CopC